MPALDAGWRPRRRTAPILSGDADGEGATPVELAVASDAAPDDCRRWKATWRLSREQPPHPATLTIDGLAIPGNPDTTVMTAAWSTELQKRALALPEVGSEKTVYGTTAGW